MKLRVYLDTSVISALFDDSVPDRWTLTREFWSRKDNYDISTSSLTQIELNQTNNVEQRSKFNDLIVSLNIFPLTEEMRNLANHYILQNVFTHSMFNDAAHVAAAVLSRQDVLLSWNFRHLVNRSRRALVNQINIAMSFPVIDILAPPEL